MRARELIATVALCLAACGGSRGGAEVRVVHAAQAVGSVRVALTPVDEAPDDASKALELGPGEVSDALEMPAAVYELEVSASGRRLVSRRLGLGHDGRYTLVFFGLVPGEDVDPTAVTTWAALDDAVGGVEARPVNNYRPGVLVLNDDVRRPTDRALVRAVSVASGLRPVDVTARHGPGEDTSVGSAVAYRHESKRPVSLKPGRWTLAAAPTGAPEAVTSARPELRAGDLVTAVVTGGPGDGEALQVIAVQVPAER